jgi:undecaprenyl-diphosphatase
VAHRVGLLDPPAVALSWLGTGGAVWLGLALVLALLWRRPSLLVWVGAADLIAHYASAELRVAAGRPRPPRRFSDIQTLVPLPHDSSFPSGHAGTSFACAVVLAAAASRRRSRALLLVLAALISLSRAYAGVHYPLDVIGGAALGTVIGLSLVALARALRPRLGGLDLFARFDQAGGDDRKRGQ